MSSRLKYVTRDGSFFLMLLPDISQIGRVTSDVINGMSVTDFTTVGHIARFVRNV